MKKNNNLEIESNETLITNHLPTTDELVTAYNQALSLDPTSVSYKRVLIRPKINWIKTFFNILIPLCIASIIGFILDYINVGILFCVIIPIVLIVCYMIIKLKAIVLFVISLYQRFAPDKIRNTCRFEPSCSVYMQKAILKYGLIKGIIKGRNRLKRCKPPYGGYDEP